MYLEPDYDVDANTRAHMHAQLARSYTELAVPPKPTQRFSFARYLQSLARRRPLVGYEGEVLAAAAAAESQRFDPSRAVVPFGCFGTRAMGAIPGSKGGYFSGADVAQPVDILRPWSVTAQAGMQMISGLSTGSLTIPRTTAAPTGAWLREFEAATESPPTLGNVSLSPKTGACFVRLTLQMLAQAPEVVEIYVRNMLLQAVGTLLDAAVLNGAGGSEPLGLTLMTGVGSQSGTSMAYAGLLNMQETILTAGGRADRLTWIAPPATAELLATRERVANGGRHLWDDGTVLGRPAQTTTTAPTGRLIVGDFSTAVIAHWGPGLTVEVDPSQDFGNAGLVARVLMFCDVAFPTPGAFVVTSAVT